MCISYSIERTDKKVKFHLFYHFAYSHYNDVVKVKQTNILHLRIHLGQYFINTAIQYVMIIPTNTFNM